MYKIEDIKPNSLVVFKKHNGKGRKITTRIVFVDFIQGNCICYHTYTGHFIWWLIPINTAIHFVVDDLKANRFKINLITDQSIHFIQIVLTFLVCYVWMIG